MYTYIYGKIDTSCQHHFWKCLFFVFLSILPFFEKINAIKYNLINTPGKHPMPLISCYLTTVHQFQ